MTTRRRLVSMSLLILAGAILVCTSALVQQHLLSSAMQTGRSTDEDCSAASPLADPSVRFGTFVPRRKLRTWRGPLPTSVALPGYNATCTSQLRIAPSSAAAASRTFRSTLHNSTFWSLPFGETLLRGKQCLPPRVGAVGGEEDDAQLALLREEVLQRLRRFGWTVEVWYMAGRRRYLNITSSYLSAMLLSNGGVAESVLWFHQADQPYVPAFIRERFGNVSGFAAFERGNIRRMYRKAASEPRKVFIKLDDDTVFIAPHTVTLIVAAGLGLLRSGAGGRCNCGVSSANVINHVGLNPVHAWLGALELHQTAFNLSMAMRGVPPYPGIQYQGINKAASGSFQHLFEWQQAHLSFLSLLLTENLAAYRFNAMPFSAGGGIFDFQCDGFYRRWGINFVAFPSLGTDHFGAMRDLGHMVKNKDEVYLSMLLGRHSRQQEPVGTDAGDTPTPPKAGTENSVDALVTCAVADAIAVHFLNTGQASNWRKHFGFSEHDERFKDAAELQPRLLNVYHSIAEHVAGTRQCCRSSCPVFDFIPASILHSPAQ